MNVVPIPNDGQHEKKKRHKEEARSFGRVRGMAMLLLGVVGFGDSNHGHIVALAANPARGAVPISRRRVRG